MYSERRSINPAEVWMSSPGTMSRFAAPGPFARDVARRGREVFAMTGENRFADGASWLRSAAFAGLGLGGYGMLLAGVGGGAAAAGWIALAAFGAFLMAADLGHDASHGALAPSRRVNETARFLVFG